MGEVLKFVTKDDGSQKKKRRKIFALFAKITKFRFERPVLSSAKRAQNKIKKNWRAQAKLLAVLSNDIMRKAKIKS